MDLQTAKNICLEYFALQHEQGPRRASERFCDQRDYRFYGIYPFDALDGAQPMVQQFWEPLWRSFTALSRRQDIFMAGASVAEPGTWVVSMGHFCGLFDHDWLRIPATRKLVMLRYAEFNRIGANGKITATGMFIDVIDLMHQVGLRPLPPSTGRELVVPGPADHGGLLLSPQAPEAGEQTLALVTRMIADLDRLNREGPDFPPPDFHRPCWHEDMAWWGPAGIGSTMSITRYQEQHQYPFRSGLDDKVFHGHVCRIAEGNYAAWFGWPNLSNRPRGGFMGMPASGRAEMRVVDIYRREGDKLAENWVLIDVPYWLRQQGLDVLERTVGFRQGEPA